VRQFAPPPAVRARTCKLDATSAAARAWSRELSDRQDAALSAAAPGVKPTAQYRTAFAGFAAALTDQHAQALRAQPAVPHSFALRWNGVTGSEPLRGLVEWDGAGDANVLDTSVVRVTPGA
jgi:hypothetical protein